MKLGLYGGSFDPIHRGHVDPVLAARANLGLDRVLYLPTGRPPHKRDRRLAPPLRRFVMVELALLDEPGLEVSTFEIDRDGPAYTVETLEHARQRWPGADLHLLVGADSFAELDTWHRFEDLLALATLVVLRRGGEPEPAESPEALRLHPAIRRTVDAGGVRFVDNPPIEASSTEIRRRLRNDEIVPAGWMRPAVLSYVQKYGLYAGSPDETRGAEPSALPGTDCKDTPPH